jgi:hypothetical protein
LLNKLLLLSLPKKVEAIVADFIKISIREPIKLLSSDDSLASFNEDVRVKPA